jgi:hypothetical protein
LFAIIAIALPTDPLSAQESPLRVGQPSILREGASLPAAGTIQRSEERFPNLDLSTASRKTHRTEGAIIGGAILGLPVLIIGIVWDDPDAGGDINVPVATLTATALGALIGAFIGGAIPKEDPGSGDVVPAAGAP